jgi:hypothetical protein
MPSPFPGMNPYIERPDLWNDFHGSFIPAVREVLAPRLRPRYYVRIEEHLFIHEPSAHERFPLGKPDLSVHPTPNGGDLKNGIAISAPASVGMPVIVEEERLPYLEIRDRNRDQVVTILELLSPSNKHSGHNRDQYLGKVGRILSSGTNLIEIDLLRGGPRMPWARLPSCDYYVIVSRPTDRTADDPHAGLWPLQLREPLPVIPVPLRAGESDATLDLQAILHHIYDAAAYSLFIYQANPEPPLTPDDAAWAAQFLNSPVDL